jgi:predicted transposase/invertase (TIGR01784 family)
MPFVLSRVVRRVNAMESLVPPSIAGRIDWRTLNVLDASFIDPELSERQTDLLYSAKLGGREALIYVLLEHQSSEDRWMVLRMLAYVTRRIEARNCCDFQATRAHRASRPAC